MWALHRLVSASPLIVPVFSYLLVSLRRGSDIVSSNIAIQLVASQTFTAPPWNWAIHSIGLLSISGFIGAFLSFFVGGRLIDLIATRMTARRGEDPQPEFRLPAMIIPAVIGPMGVLTFGLVIAARDGWGGAAVGYGMEAFAATSATNIVMTYAVDAYRPVSQSGPPSFLLNLQLTALF